MRGVIELYHPTWPNGGKVVTKPKEVVFYFILIYLVDELILQTPIEISEPSSSTSLVSPFLP